MGVTRTLGLVEDPRYGQHRGPPGHPERPERLAAVAHALATRREPMARIAARPASDAEILTVHPVEHLQRLEEAVRRAPVHLDPDTYVGSASFHVARLAAGGAVDAADAVARGRVPVALAAVRPPGHHAEAVRAMGFCLLNNVAIAARALQRSHAVERILVVDWDVHHGNGTQHVFEEDRDVLYFSAHQYPFYPGTGAAKEAGRGRGLGATVNVPLPAGCGDPEWVGVLRRVLVPIAQRFRPQVVLVSCGFDAHAEDPLGAMQVSNAGFREMAHVVRALADELCEGRLALVLEGGYAPGGLAGGTSAVLDALLDPEPPGLGPAPDAPPGSGLAAALDRVVEVHGQRHPDLGAA